MIFGLFDGCALMVKRNDNRIVLMAVCLLGSNFVCEWNGLPNGWSTSRMMHATCRLYEIKCISHMPFNWSCFACLVDARCLPNLIGKVFICGKREEEKKKNKSFSWVFCCARNKTSAFSVCLQLSMRRQMMPTTWSFQFVLYDDFS